MQHALLQHLNRRQKGIIATVFAGGVWPRDRLRSAGYEAPPECELCGASQGLADSVHHRLWVRPHSIVIAARGLAKCPPRPPPPPLLREALTAYHRDLSAVYNSGRHVVDPNDWPAPAEHFFNVFQLAAPDGTLHDAPVAEYEQRASQGEVCYVDGACFLGRRFRHRRPCRRHRLRPPIGSPLYSPLA